MYLINMILDLVIYPILHNIPGGRHAWASGPDMIIILRLIMTPVNIVEDIQDTIIDPLLGHIVSQIK